VLKIRFQFDGKCRMHRRYNPREDGEPADRKCAGCESLYVIFLYTRIAERKAQAGNGIEARVKTLGQTDRNSEGDSQNDDATAQQGEPVDQETLALESPE
jgi:hypothetical protein